MRDRITVSILLFAAVVADAAPPPSENEPPKASRASFSIRSEVAETYWRDRERGWFWYQDPPRDFELKEPPKSEPPAPVAKPAETLPPELTQFEALQKHLEQLEHIAYISPTEENVRRYLLLKTEVVDKASRFADVWQRVVWATPDLDPTVTGRPVTAKALEVFRSEGQREQERTAASLAGTHALLFFFRSDCPYCHQFAPMLTQFHAKYGIDIVPISMDGGALPDFPKPRMDNGISARLNVQRWPALFLMDPAAAKITPIGYGVLAESELLERLYTITRPEADKMVPSVTKTVTLQ